MSEDRSRRSAHLAPTPRGGGRGRGEKHVGHEKPAGRASHARPEGRAVGEKPRAAARPSGRRMADVRVSRPADVRPARPERPVRLASESDQISTIGAGQGAQVTTRHNAAEAAGRARRNAELRYAERHPEARPAAGGPQRSRRNVVLLVAAAVLVLVVVFAAGTLVNSLLFPPAQQADETLTDQKLRLTESEQQVQAQQDEHDAGQEQVGTDGTVSYDGSTYGLAQAADGSWGLAGAGGEVICRLEGTPVALLRTGSTLLVPENTDAGWDVACYVIGGHTDLSYVMAGDEKAGGTGTISADGVSFDGTALRVTDDAGETTDVALV